MRGIPLASVIGLLLLAGCSRQPESRLVLVTAYVEMQETQGERVLSTTNLSKTSFIAMTEKPVSISLPLGEGYGCCTCFELHIEGSSILGSSILVSNLCLSYGGRKNRALFPEDDDTCAYEGPNEACSESASGGLLGNPIQLARWGYGRNERWLNFKVFILVEPLKSEPLPKRDNVYEYQGKLYHLLQNVDPRTMRYGKQEG